MLGKFKDNIKENIDNFDKKSNDHLDMFNNKVSTLNDKISKIKDIIKNNVILTNAEKNELQNKIEIINKEKNELQENIEKTTSQKNSINNEHRRAVDTIKKDKEPKKYENNLETMKKVKTLEEYLKNANKSLDVLNDLYTNNLEKNKKIEEDLENAYKAIDILTKNKYDPNGFDIYGNHKDTGDKYDLNGFDRDGYNINDVNKDGLDRYGIKRTVKKTSKIKTSKAKSFKDQKGEGYVDSPILLSKLNINSSKELISNIEQLIHNSYNNKQITKQVYNILNKAITYVQSTNVYDIYKNDS